MTFQEIIGLRKEAFPVDFIFGMHEIHSSGMGSFSVGLRKDGAYFLSDFDLRCAPFSNEPVLMLPREATNLFFKMVEETGVFGLPGRVMDPEPQRILHPFTRVYFFRDQEGNLKTIALQNAESLPEITFFRNLLHKFIHAVKEADIG